MLFVLPIFLGLIGIFIGYAPLNLLRGDIIGSGQTVPFYNNLYSASYKDLPTPEVIDMKEVSNAPSIKMLDRNTFGAHVADTGDVRTFGAGRDTTLYTAFMKVLGLSGVRDGAFERYDPIDEYAARKVYLRYFDDTTERMKAAGDLTDAAYAARKTQSDYNKKVIFQTDATGAIKGMPIHNLFQSLIDLTFPDKTQTPDWRTVYAINVGYGYDSATKEVCKVTENPSVCIPIVAKRSAEIVKFINERYQNTTNRHVYFELGNESGADIYGDLSLRMYLDVVKASITAMKVEDPQVKVSIVLYNPTTATLLAKARNKLPKPFTRENYPPDQLIQEKYYFYNADDTISMSYQDMLKELVQYKGNLVGLSHHLYAYGYPTWEVGMDGYRRELIEAGLGEIQYWISEYNPVALNALSHWKFPFTATYLISAWQLGGRPDVRFADYHNLPGAILGENNTNGKWSTSDCSAAWNICVLLPADPMIDGHTNQFWRMLSQGYASKAVKDVLFTKSNQLDLKVLRSGSGSVFEVLGKGETGKIHGFLINQGKETKQMQLKNLQVPFVKILTLDAPLRSGSLYNFENQAAAIANIRVALEKLMPILNPTDGLKIPGMNTTYNNHAKNRILRDVNAFKTAVTPAEIRPALASLRNGILGVMAKDVAVAATEDYKAVKTLFESLEITDQDVPAYKADLRLDHFPQIKEYYLYPSNSGEVTLSLAPGTIVFLSEEEFTNTLEQGLLDSLPLIKEAVSTGKIPAATMPQVIPFNANSVQYKTNTNTNISNINLNLNLNLNSVLISNTNVNSTVLSNTNLNSAPIGNLNKNSDLCIATDTSYVFDTTTRTCKPQVVWWHCGESRSEIMAKGQCENAYLTPPKATPSVTFTDINAHFAKVDIAILAAKGIIEGRSSGRFEPNETLNRAEAVKLAVKAFYSNKESTDFIEQFQSLHPTYGYLYFKDVVINSWYAGYIGIAKEQGIISGTSEGNFEPTRSVTRAEFLKIVLSAGKKTSEDLIITKGVFTDVPSNSWFAAYVSDAARLGIIEKREKFEPMKPITRGEAAKILSKSLK